MKDFDSFFLVGMGRRCFWGPAVLINTGIRHTLYDVLFPLLLDMYVFGNKSIDIGGAKEPGMMHSLTIRGAEEHQNL